MIIPPNVKMAQKVTKRHAKACLFLLFLCKNYTDRFDFYLFLLYYIVYYECFIYEHFILTKRDDKG